MENIKYIFCVVYAIAMLQQSRYKVFLLQPGKEILLPMPMLPGQKVL